MRLAIISDTQIGARNDYVPFLENNKRFFKEVFFPKLKEAGVQHVVHLGDLVERRKFINFNTAKHIQDDFLHPFYGYGLTLHWILGNHDIYWRNQSNVNAAELLLGTLYYASRNYFHFYSTATEVQFDEAHPKMLFVPWIVDSNRAATMKLIQETDAKILMGHLELQNFETQQGIKSREGLDPSILDKFEVVMSGHFHIRQAKNSIYYVGSFAEFSWSEYGTEHGFHIFDTHTREIEFVKNPFSVFQKVWYDDSSEVPLFPDPATIKGKIVKLIVTSKKNQSLFDSFYSHLESSQPLDITTVEDHLNVHLIDDENIISDTKSTLDIMREFAQQSNNIVNTEKLDRLFVDLFNGAQNLE